MLCVRLGLTAALAAAWLAICSVVLINTHDAVSQNKQQGSATQRARPTNEQPKGRPTTEPNTVTTAQESSIRPKQETGGSDKNARPPGENATMNESIIGLTPNAWIAFFTFFLVIITATQVCVYWAMHESTKVIERAYVDMSHDPPGLTVVPGHAINIIITNHGKTPAIVTAVNLTYRQHGEPLPKTPEYNDILTVRTRTVVMPGQRFTHERRHPLVGSGHATLPQTVATPGIQGIHAWLIGYVDYMDRFGGRHRGGYGRRYQPSTPNNNLVFIDADGYNYDRDRNNGEGNDWDEPQG
jgi:hypothetical protein